MPLTPCRDTTAAEWIAASDLPWQQLVSFGPAGFAAYARLRFLPDPAYQGQRENDIGFGVHRSETEQLREVLETLTLHTRTSGSCYFCVWDGWGDIDARPVDVVVPNRAYYLFRGAVSDVWHMPDPAFIWPADRAWCVANDVDPHWAGIGASTSAVAQLLADPRLDVVLADPREAQPFYL